MAFSRKKFLKRAAAAAAAIPGAGLLGGAYSYFANSNYKKEFPEIPGNNVHLPENGRSVLILGGGLSGLQAACELVDRGFKVTLLEKSGTPGGKLKAWRDVHFAKKYFGPDGYPREHGLHGVWGFYKNFREFLGRHKIPLNRLNDEESFYHFVDSQGVQNRFKTMTWPIPFDRVQQMRSPGLYIPSPHDVYQKDDGDFSAGLASLKLWGFDYTDDDQRLYLDSITFYDWAKARGVSDQWIRYYFDAIAEMGFFMTSKECSALAVAEFVRLGVVPRDARVDFFSWPPDESFIHPMIRHIQSRGGKILYNLEVTGLKIEGGKVAGAYTNQNIPPGRVRRCRICGNLIYGNQEFDHCPFCGAHHDRIEELSAMEKVPGFYSADHYIVAMDVPGARKVLMGSPPLTQTAYFDNITGLTNSTILCVNLLYEHSDGWDSRFVPGSYFSSLDFMPTGYKVLGFTTNWSNKQIPQLKKNKVDLIEVQVSKWQQFADKSYAEIAEAVHRELKTIMPALRDYTDFYINRWDTYTGFRPGDEKKRPEIQSPVENLMFIGDWVHIPTLTVFMERTNVSAKMVTNLILEKSGIKEGRIEILKSGTPDWPTDLIGLFTGVD